MRVTQIEHEELSSILSRNSMTFPSYLNDNSYECMPFRKIKNGLYLAWVREEYLDLSILAQKLRYTHLVDRSVRLCRREVRYAQLSKERIEMSNLIEYLEKYNEFKIAAIFQNDQIVNVDMSGDNLVCLTNSGKLDIINMVNQQIKRIECTNEMIFKQVILSENELYCFYVLDSQQNLHCIQFNCKPIDILKDNSEKDSFPINISNYRMKIGNNENNRLRIIKLSPTHYLLYSDYCYIFFLSIKRNKKPIFIQYSHYIKNLQLNLIISQITPHVFILHNSSTTGNKYLIFTELALSPSLEIFTLKDISLSNTRTISSTTKFDYFIGKFTTKKQLYLALKSGWSLDIFKKLVEHSECYYLYFSGYVQARLENFLSLNDISALQLLHLSIVFLISFKPKVISLLIQQLDILIVDQKIRQELFSRIWDFIPFFDHNRAQIDQAYTEIYINVAKILNKTSQIAYLFKKSQQ